MKKARGGGRKVSNGKRLRCLSLGGKDEVSVPQGHKNRKNRYKKTTEDLQYRCGGDHWAVTEVGLTNMK